MLFCDLQCQYRAYKQEMEDAIGEVMTQTNFIHGEPVKLLEEELAAYLGVRHCVTCANGTDALVLSLMAIGVGPGDEVITSPFTFFATAEAVSAVGATPVFADIEPDTYNLDPNRIKEKITPQTRALLPVSIFGQPASMDEIVAIANEHGLDVIEDAAQSFGARYLGRRSGALSTVGCTSFYPTKPLGCYGDGGALFTDDYEIATKAREYANHGQSERNKHTRIGMNSRLDTIQAAVLRVRLSHLENELSARQTIAERYLAALQGANGVVPPRVRQDRSSVWAQFSIQLSERERFRQHLAAQGVPTAVYYEKPIYKQEVYAELQADPSQFPVTEELCQRVVSLPMSSHLTSDSQAAVIAAMDSYSWA